MDYLQPVSIRLGTRSQTRGQVLALYFPNTGTLSANTNLGICWANPNYHTQALSLDQGFDFANGWGYFSLNLNTFQSSNNASDGSYAIKLFLVDAAGADVRQISSNSVQMQAGFNNYDSLSLGSIGGQAVGNGIRGQFTAATNPGAMISINIPYPMLFFGSKGPT
jgi:hypothetical protein